MVDKPNSVSGFELISESLSVVTEKLRLRSVKTGESVGFVVMIVGMSSLLFFLPEEFFDEE